MSGKKSVAKMTPIPSGPRQDTPEEKYSLLGYKRLILDYHYSEFVPHTLVDADPQEIVDVAEYLGLNSLLLYAKDQWGNVYHDTKISHKHKNVPYDLFGQVSRDLKEKGIETIAYFTVCWDEGAARAHPEWKVVGVRGGPVQDGGSDPTAAKWAFLCLNTSYRDYVLRQARELIENYDMAALFLDIILYWPGANDCYCPYCQEKWRALYGEDIPKSFTPVDAARYLDFITETLKSFCAEVKDIIQESGKDIWLTHNFGTFYDLDDYAVMEIDPYGRDYLRSSFLAKTYRARFDGGEVELIGHRHNGIWDYMTKPVLTLKWEAATAVAHDCAIMYVDQPNIKGDLEPVVYEKLREAFRTAEELVPHVHGTTPYAEIALLDSERSMAINPQENRDQAGAYKVLSELHVPFDLLSDTHLDRDRLAEFDLLIVADTHYLSQEVRDTIREYVETGGNLLFCHRSAFGDEMGREIDEKSFGLAQTLGDSGHLVEFIRPTFKLKGDESHDLRIKVKGSEKLAPLEEVEVLATYTPPCIDVTPTEWVAHQPMPGIDTDEPAVVLGRKGKGRYIYLGCRIFKDYLYQDHPTIRQLIRECIERLAAPRVYVRAPRVVEAVYARKGSVVKVFLLNGITGRVSGQVSVPRGEDEFVFHTNIDELIPIHDIEIVFGNYTIACASDIGGTELDVSDGRVRVPKLDLYDVITVELAEDSA